MRTPLLSGLSVPSNPSHSNLVERCFTGLALSAAITLAVTAMPAVAQTDEDEIAEIRRQIELLSERLERLEDGGQQRTAAASADLPLVNIEALADAMPVTTDMSSSGLKVSSRDTGYSFNMGGRMHLDYFLHDHLSGLGTQPTNGTALRRARLEIDGTFARDWAYAAEIDFGNAVVHEVKDVKLGYIGGENWSLFVGNQKQPYSLALEMSSNDLPFTERSVDIVPAAVYMDRAIGVRLDMHGDDWFLAGGVYGDEVDADGVGDKGWAAVGRVVVAPYQDDNQVLHLGLRAARRGLDDTLKTMLRNKTTDNSNFSVVSTGIIPNVEQVDLFGPEFGYVHGPLLLMGEYSEVNLSRTEEFRDLEFEGWHLSAALALTGENRAATYSMSNGEFKGLKPDRFFNPGQNAWGAVELVARYATLDLNDQGLTGGSIDTAEVGANWYMNNNIRFMLNWQHVLDTDESSEIREVATGMDVFTLRAQYNY